MKKYRDGLFRHFFNDKARLLDLCNALLGTNGTDPDEIKRKHVSIKADKITDAEVLSVLQWNSA